MTSQGVSARGGRGLLASEREEASNGLCKGAVKKEAWSRTQEQKSDIGGLKLQKNANMSGGNRKREGCARNQEVFVEGRDCWR